MKEERFWMVWNPQGHSPTFRHLMRSEAVSEAERLARTNPGQRFYVLAAIAARIVDNMTRIDLPADDDEDIPF